MAYYERSVKMAKLPEKKGIVRAHSHIISVKIMADKTDPKLMNVECILHNDGRGYIPPWMMNMFSTMMCKAWVKEFVKGLQTMLLVSIMSSHSTCQNILIENKIYF